MALKPGDLIGPYEIRGFIGQGGMGQVYRAFDPRLERTIALKIIVIPEADRRSQEPGASGKTPSRSESGRFVAPSGEFSARLLREARAVASLNHPNVVAIYDVGESDGRLYLAMEYVVGSPLRNLVGNEELPLSRRLRWLIDVARALEAAHKTGIVHRDIKPENVMIREDGGVKVLDFGIARRTVTKAEDQHVVDTVTGGGSIAGTPVYMAPEQIKGGEVDARCDQFAWAVMAYEVVVGERPWVETGDVLSLVANILTETPRSIRSRKSEVPGVVEETILKALAKEPAQRFASMAQVADALEPFASLATGGDRVRITPSSPASGSPHDGDAAFAATTRVPTTVSVEPPPEAKAERSPRRRALALAAPLFLLGALGAAVWIVKTRPTDQPQPPVVGSAARPLSTVPAAEAAYKDAMRLWHDGASVKARAALESAVSLDPTFAAAHLERALQDASINELTSAQAAFQSAFEHRHMLLARDSALLEASEPFVRVHPDVEEWETRMTAVVFQHPRDSELQYYLGRARLHQGDLDGARAAFVASTRLDDSFVPGLAMTAKVEQRRGNVKDAFATTDECIKRSPVAATCVATRFELFFATGQCKEASNEARTWGGLEPQSPIPFRSLAHALHATGAPRPSIEEALGRRWSLVAPAERAEIETWDRALLAVHDGDLARADELARQYEAALAVTADAYDHARPARLRINVLMDEGRMKDAAKVARVFLDRLPAWAAYPFAPDPGLDFQEPLYRAGEITRRELDDRRVEWLAAEQKRTGRGTRTEWTTWAHVYGSFAETKEEALDAIAKMPRAEPLPPIERRTLHLDFSLGKVYALAGRWDEALPSLKNVDGSCDTFESSMVIARARLLFAEALEAKGEAAAALALYQKVLDAYGGASSKTSTSRTAKRAAERVAALAR